MGGQRELFLASSRFNLTEWLSLDRMRKLLLSFYLFLTKTLLRWLSVLFLVHLFIAETEREMEKYEAIDEQSQQIIIIKLCADL